MSYVIKLFLKLLLNKIIMILTHIMSFIAALRKEVNNGFLIVDRNTRQYRSDICKRCSHKTKIGRCSVCGCIINIKILFPEERCPLTYWNVSKKKLCQNQQI